MNKEINEKMSMTNDHASYINDLLGGDNNKVEYFINIYEEITKYPFWKIFNITKIKEYISFSLNNGKTLILVRYVDSKEMFPHITYLLHQSISSYLKKRKIIKTKTKLDFLAKKTTTVIIIKPK